MRLDFPVMLTNLSIAAVLQELTPAWGHGKWPFLIAVVAYYALQRELMAALVAAVWAGVLMDATDHLRFFCTPVCLVLIALVLRHLRVMLQANAVWQGMVAMSLVAPMVMFWQGLFGQVAPAGWWFDHILLNTVMTALRGAVVAIIGFNFAAAFDRMAGNVKGFGSVDGTSWSECT